MIKWIIDLHVNGYKKDFVGMLLGDILTSLGIGGLLLGLLGKCSGNS